MSRTTTEPTSFAGRKILFVMAAETEIGEHLRKRITPLITGVGPVETAITLTASLHELAAAKKLPDLIVSMGAAGSRVLEQGEVYQVSDVTYRDMDASALGYEKGVTPHLDQPATIVLPYVIPGLPRASLSSGGTVVTGFAFDSILAQMVDMETYSVVRVAERFGIPVVGLRGVLEAQPDLADAADAPEGLAKLDKQLAEALDKLAAAFEGEAIPL
ncbi:MAG: 5'-methylthioadenosine/S-adenosylhomocysteine nucleosidase [Rhizobiaceae bacterium]